MANEGYVGSYKIGDKVTFRYNDMDMEGTIENILPHQIVIKPDTKNTRFYEGFRVCISNNELLTRLVDIKKEPMNYGTDEEGNLTF